MSRYAENTDVASDRSRAEIERTLQRYGATAFMYGWDGGRAVIGFQMKGKRVRFELPLPDRNAKEFVLTPTQKYKRSVADADKAWEQACRQRWRALALVVKAKLEAVEAGITTFEEEFLAHIVLPGDRTIWQTVQPNLTIMLETGKLPALLPGKD